jgi:predicted 2-oxoglutarate/Fe(II)-dependent dioxygenase YbiX
MTPPNKYSGGDTIVYNDSNITLSKEVGSGIIFPSSTDHELTEITNGERFSFVVMFKETLNNSLL